MYTTQPQIDMLALLCEQHRLYACKLGWTHEGLSKLYKKLAKIERKLARSREQGLSRSEKKKLQWSRSVTKTSIYNLEGQRANLHGLSQQCMRLIVCHDGSMYGNRAAHWSGQMPHSPYTFSPLTPFPPTPWTAGPYRECFGEGSSDQPPPQYWDLSMLRERDASPTPGSGDSGFHEPSSLPGGVTQPDHVFSHELMSASIDSATTATSSVGSKRSSLSEQDELPDLLLSVSTAKPGAERSSAAAGQRRYSDITAKSKGKQLEPRTTHHRGSSVGRLAGGSVTDKTPPSFE